MWRLGDRGAKRSRDEAAVEGRAGGNQRARLEGMSSVLTDREFRRMAGCNDVELRDH